MVDSFGTLSLAVILAIAPTFTLIPQDWAFCWKPNMLKPSSFRLSPLVFHIIGESSPNLSPVVPYPTLILFSQYLPNEQY